LLLLFSATKVGLGCFEAKSTTSTTIEFLSSDKLAPVEMAALADLPTGANNNPVFARSKARINLELMIKPLEGVIG
jgi:hypothetical protein